MVGFSGSGVDGMAPVRPHRPVDSCDTAAEGKDPADRSISVCPSEQQSRLKNKGRAAQKT
jgi:hypothetical protein